MLIGTVGSDGRADVSPRGEAPGFVHVLDDKRLALPDRPATTGSTALTNIVTNPAVGLCFLVPGVHEALRINGQAEIRDDEDLKGHVRHQGPLARDRFGDHRAGSLSAMRQVGHAVQAVGPGRPDRPLRTADHGQMLRDQIGGDMEAEPQDKMLERYKDSFTKPLSR